MFFLLKAMVLSNLRLKRTGAKGDSYRKIFENPLDNSSFFIYASQSRQRGRLPYEDNEPAKSRRRFLLFSIPDLIRDPEGRRHSSFKKIVLEAKNGC